MQSHKIIQNRQGFNLNITAKDPVPFLSSPESPLI